ncbi:MAG: hypothetical protein V1875_08370 [Candidatus Altiarchaeota archaeon]
MAFKKKAKKESLTEEQKKKIKAVLQKAEDKVIANYRTAASMSGADWVKLSKHVRTKVKKDMSKAEARIESEVKKNPASATVVAAAIGAIVGVIVMSKLRGK